MPKLRAPCKVIASVSVGASYTAAPRANGASNVRTSGGKPALIALGTAINLGSLQTLADKMLNHLNSRVAAGVKAQIALDNQEYSLVNG